MDIIVPNFVRVQRGLADSSHVQALFDKIETGGENVALSESDRLTVLDFPDFGFLTSSLAAATHLSRQVLLGRAVFTPDRLTPKKSKSRKTATGPTSLTLSKDFKSRNGVN